MLQKETHILYIYNGHKETISISNHLPSAVCIHCMPTENQKNEIITRISRYVHNITRYIILKCNPRRWQLPFCGAPYNLLLYKVNSVDCSLPGLNEFELLLAVLEKSRKRRQRKTAFSCHKNLTSRCKTIYASRFSS